MLLVTVRGYVVRAGGGWSGHLFVASCEKLENLSASEICVKRFKHQEVSQEGTLSFPCPDESLKLCDLPHRGGRPAEDENKVSGPNKRRKNV